MLQCLTNIIGITESECECLVSGISPENIEEMKKSTSGLFLDQLPGGVDLKALQEIDTCTSMYGMATGAVANSIKRLEDDLIIAVNEKYTKNKKTFTGQIGRMSYSQSLPVNHAWQGVQIVPVEFSDAVMTVNKLQIVLNQNVNVTVKLFRVPSGGAQGEEIGSYPVSAISNSYAVVNGVAGLKLPTIVNGQLMEYYFAYNLDGLTAAPKDNTLICLPCTGGVAGYNQYIKANGVQFASPAALNAKTTDTYSRGLILDVSIRCDTSKLFCDVYSQEDALAVTMAYSVWFKAGELLIEAVMMQTEINRYTTMDREYLWGKRNHFRKEYDNRLLYLAATMDVSSSNCYLCRQTANQPFMSNIII